MTEPADGVREAVEGMVAAALPGWDVAAVGRYEGCSDDVYPLEVTDGDRHQRLVLKARNGTDAASFRTEPYLLDAVARRTDVPVPGVVAVVDDHDDWPPFFLLEHCDGETLDERADALVPAVRDRLAREAGQYLGQLHLLGSFDRFGPLRVDRTNGLERDEPAGRPDEGPGRGETPTGATGSPGNAAGEAGGRPDPGPGTPGDDDATIGASGDRGPGAPGADERPPAERALPEAGIEEPGFTIDVVERGHDAWEPRFRDLVADHCSGLDGRFADLAADVETALAAVPVPAADPVLVHDDYRYWNLLADPMTGETRAVIDFDASTAAARWNLVATVDRLSAWAPLDADRRRRVRECVLVGYETATGRRPDLDAPACDAYRLASRLPALACFEDWHAETCPDERDAIAERHRDHVATLVERCLDAQ